MRESRTSSTSKNSLLPIEDGLLKAVFVHALNREGFLMLLMGVDLGEEGVVGIDAGLHSFFEPTAKRMFLETRHHPALKIGGGAGFNGDLF